MGAIDIKGVKVSACHGVLESEKSNPQLFVFDVAIDCDINAAAKSDDVNDTVNYADVCAMVAAYCKRNGFNLIERLARGAAELIIKAYPQISSVSVTVHKPQAPVPVPFGDVSVTATVERNTVILSLGSSEGDKSANLGFALERLAAVDGIEVVKTSRFIQSEPYGGAAKNTFVNCAAVVTCLLTPRELLENIHRIEAEAGRVRTVRWGDRTLDVDIIFFGNKIIEEEGLCVPHPDYLNRSFVITPLKEIAPGFVCPDVHKRIADL